MSEQEMMKLAREAIMQALREQHIDATELGEDSIGVMKRDGTRLKTIEIKITELEG
jgi:hypothetical protein